MSEILVRFDELLSPERTAEVTGLKLSTLATWRCTKMKGPPYLKCGGKVLYRAGDVADWLEQQLVRPGMQLAEVSA